MDLDQPTAPTVVATFEDLKGVRGVQVQFRYAFVACASGLAAVDVTPFTGGTAQPPLALDPALLGLVLGGFVLVVAAAVAVSTAVSRRTNLAAQLRIGEER